MELDRWATVLEFKNERGWDWGLALLEYCPDVKDLGTSADTDEQVDYLAPVLFNLRPTLHHLSLGGRQGFATISHLNALLEASEISALASLTLNTPLILLHASIVESLPRIRLDSLCVSYGFPFDLGSLYIREQSFVIRCLSISRGSGRSNLNAISSSCLAHSNFAGATTFSPRSNRLSRSG